jgi:hypothetical protein
MKNSLKHLKFWLKKRNELLINDDPQTDWLSMQSLLETHLPVNNHPGITKGSSFKGKLFKMLPKLLITLSAAAMVYTASYFILKKVHQHYPHLVKLSRADSVYKDSLIADSVALFKDRLLSVNQSKANDSNIDASTGNKKEAADSLPNNNPNETIANNKTNSSTTTSAQNKNQPGIINKANTNNKINQTSTTNNKTIGNNKAGTTLSGNKVNQATNASSSGTKIVGDNKLGSSPSSGNKTIVNKNAGSLITIKTVPGKKLGSSPSAGNKTNTVKKLNGVSLSNAKTVNRHKSDAASLSSNNDASGNKPANELLISHSVRTHKIKTTTVLTSNNKKTLDNKTKHNLLASNKTIGGNRHGSALMKNNRGTSDKHLLSILKNNKWRNAYCKHSPSGSSKLKPTTGTQTVGSLDNDAADWYNKQHDTLTAAPPQTLNDAVNNSRAADLKKSNQKPVSKLLTDQLKKEKSASQKKSTLSKLDWGILSGVNASSSFTSSKQNANFYGSSPVDVYFGLFATYNLNNKWAVGFQIQFYSPQNVTTSYTHANASKVDSTQSLQITASRKLYTVNIPVNVIYKLTDNFRLMGGPVIGVPVKQINTSSTLLPAAIKTDSAYYAQISGILNGTKYEQKLNMGLNAGVGFQYKRWLFEANYLKSLTGYSMSNSWGTYKSSGGTFQFTIGFQISKPKQ